MIPFRDIRDARLTDERGTIFKQAELPFALCYPSPYAVGMSSLGFQTIYRRLNGLQGVAAERAFLPDDSRAARTVADPLRTYESGRPVGDFPVVAFSLAYELELAGLVDCLDMAGIPLLAEERLARAERFPLIVIGGPLTFSNPVPAAPYADVILLGEAEETIIELCDAIRSSTSRGALLAHLASRPGFYVPPVHGEHPPAVAAADDTLLPAFSQILTPHTELANMFLIEPERGCHRGCTYCVMRRSTNGGMRLVAAGAREVADPGRRAPGRAGGRGRHGPPGPARDPALHRGQRAAGRDLQLASRSPGRRDRRAAPAGRLPDADHRRRRRRPSGCATRSSARRGSGTSCAPPSWPARMGCSS